MNAKVVELAATRPAPRATSAAPSAETAREFLMSLRRAGYRPNENGVMVPGSRDDRERDERAAVARFTGNPVAGPLGAALDAARAAAQRALRAPAPRAAARATEPYRHGASAAPTVAGFVAGLPHPAELTRRSLEAQERLVVEELASATDSAAADIARAKLAKIQSTLDSLP